MWISMGWFFKEALRISLNWLLFLIVIIGAWFKRLGLGDPRLMSKLDPKLAWQQETESDSRMLFLWLNARNKHCSTKSVPGMCMNDLDVEARSVTLHMTHRLTEFLLVRTVVLGCRELLTLSRSGSIDAKRKRVNVSGWRPPRQNREREETSQF